MSQLVSLEEARRLVGEGRPLLFAGDEALLAELPRGRWIGGTTPYFMAEAGGLKTSRSLFVHRFPPFVEHATAKLYAVDELSRIPADYPENGMSFIILPAASTALTRFGQDCVSWKGLFDRPLIGWVAGVDLDRLGQAKAKVLDGVTGQWSDDAAVVLHASLPSGRSAHVDIVNLFVQGDGPAITFETEGFLATECQVDGVTRNLADYIAEQKLDTRLPLVADYHGAMINISFQGVDADAKQVSFYAPTVKGVTYRHARALDGDYAALFARALAEQTTRPTFACNCILNYLYGKLEGKKTGSMLGPITFGEVAYMLLNQTMVHLRVE